MVELGNRAKFRQPAFGHSVVSLVDMSSAVMVLRRSPAACLALEKTDIIVCLPAGATLCDACTAGTYSTGSGQDTLLNNVLKAENDVNDTSQSP